MSGLLKRFSMGGGLAPNVPAAVMETVKLPPKATATHVFFFGYEGTDPENTFQRWDPSPYVDDSTSAPTHFQTTEHYMMHLETLLMGDEEIAEKFVQAQTPAEAKMLSCEV